MLRNAILHDDFFSFARKAIKEAERIEVKGQPYLEFLATELMAIENGTITMVNLPPQHLKTWFCTICFVAWGVLGRTPSTKVIIVTHGEHLAKKIARAIRSILQEGWYGDTFGASKER